MRVLALCSYPKEAAATRFRIEQFIEPLSRSGIELDIRPFLSSRQFRELYSGGGVVKKAAGMLQPLAGRLQDVFGVRSYDLIFVQREAMIFGPGVFEWLFQKIGNLPMVLDLDDATYIPYTSPSYGRLGSFFKFFGKTDNLIRRADAVICGNRFIAEHVDALGTRSVVIPTVVDTDKFRPRDATPESVIPTLGWIGTHSTFPFLESIFPVLERLAEKYRFVLKVVGAGNRDITVKGVEVINLDWELDREIEDFRSLDIGLYPITLSDSANREWLLGKSGFKAIQYMAVGVPFVMSPVGVGGDLGEKGSTHFEADTNEDWFERLDMLLGSAETRSRMGTCGRQFALQHYTVGQQVEKLVSVFTELNRKP